MSEFAICMSLSDIVMFTALMLYCSRSADRWDMLRRVANCGDEPGMTTKKTGG